jgi:hypothetical protein
LNRDEVAFFRNFQGYSLFLNSKFSSINIPFFK